MGWLASQGWVLYKTGQAVCNEYNYLTGLSIYSGNITKSGQAVCDGYNYLTGLSIYHRNITKSGQAVYNGYNYLTGLSIHNGNITKSGQAVYNGVIHWMYWPSQSVNNWFFNSSAGPFKME